MDKLDLILTVMISGHGLVLALMYIVWGSLHKRIDDVENNLGKRIDKLDEKVTDIDRRVCRMEGAFNNKECCMIKDSSQMRKAE